MGDDGTHPGPDQDFLHGRDSSGQGRSIVGTCYMTDVWYRGNYDYCNYWIMASHTGFDLTYAYCPPASPDRTGSWAN